MAALWVQFSKEALVFKGGFPQIASIITLCFCSLGRTISAHCRQSTVSWEMLTSTSGIMSRPCRFVQRVENTCHQLLCLELFLSSVPQARPHIGKNNGGQVGRGKGIRESREHSQGQFLFLDFQLWFFGWLPSGKAPKSHPYGLGLKKVIEYFMKTIICLEWSNMPYKHDIVFH